MIVSNKNNTNSRDLRPVDPASGQQRHGVVGGLEHQPSGAINRQGELPCAITAQRVGLADHEI
jgi:hypothetical protein